MLAAPHETDGDCTLSWHVRLRSFPFLHGAKRSPSPARAVRPSSVDVYIAAKPDRPNVEIGFFEIEQQSPASGGTPEMMRKLRERAGMIGCDALVIMESTDRVQSYSGQTCGTVPTTLSGPGPGAVGTCQGMSCGTANHVRGHRAVCIVYSDAPSYTSTPPSPTTNAPTESAPAQQL